MFNCNYGPNPFPNTDGLHSIRPQNNFVSQKSGQPYVKPYPQKSFTQMYPFSGSAYVNRKRKSDGQSVAQSVFAEKNPLQLLHEVHQGCKFELVSSVGPAHDPVFLMDLLLPDGRQFRASGQSKHSAKTSAAILALGGWVPSNNKDQSKMSDAAGKTSSEGQVQDNSSPNCKKARQLKLVNADGSFKTPLTVLFETCAKISFDKEELKDSITNEKYFLSTINVDGKEFTAEARSKKMARHRCAQIALREIYNVNVNLPCEIISNGGVPTGNDYNSLGTEVTSFSHKEQAFADKVQRKVLQRFRMLQLTCEKQYARRKVLAGVLMTRVNVDESSSTETSADPAWVEAEPELICVTSGTKCIGGEFLSSIGLAVNDCHAEILARRCLQRFLYCQMELLLDIEEARKTDSVSQERLEAAQHLCVLEWSASSDDEGDPKKELRKFQLCKGVDFHIYISTAPCGDARVFSPRELLNDVLEDEHPQRRSRGVLRTKIESGEGTVPLGELSGQQTWDGIMSGERLLTMSCSDKMCAWNVVGMQGALLARLLNHPVYPASVVLGSLYNAQHFSRALFGRLETTESLTQRLQSPYRVHKPRLLTVTEKDARQVGNSPNFALNWIVTDDMVEVVGQLGPAAQNEASMSGAGPEIIACTKGRLLEDWPSRICKQALLWRFAQVASRLGLQSAETALKSVREADFSSTSNFIYADLKGESHEYQHAKECMRQVLKSAGLGSWARKPIEQDQFRLVLVSKNKTTKTTTVPEDCA